MITKKCEYCGTSFKAKTERAKWCKKSCGQRAYEKRRGLETPKFIAAYKQSGIKKVPTQIGAKINHLKHGSNSRIHDLRLQKKALISRYIKLSKKQEIYGRNGAILGVSAGIALGLKLNQKSDYQILQSLAVGALFGYIGNVFGQEAGAETSKDVKKMESLKREMHSIDNRINTYQVTAASLEDLEKKEKIKMSVSMSGLELSQLEFDSYTVEGKYKQLIGEVERGFNMAIYGAAGSGKSSIAIDLITNLKNHGKVMYFATEEGISQALASKIKRYGAKSPYITFSKENNWSNIKQSIKDVEYVVFDSIERINDITPDELNELYNKFPNITFISILQCNKDGSYKGDSKYIHDVDIVWKVKSMSTWNEKNRYGGSGNVELNNNRGDNDSNSRIERM